LPWLQKALLASHSKSNKRSRAFIEDLNAGQTMTGVNIMNQFGLQGSV
jgi:hypothetical protein